MMRTLFVVFCLLALASAVVIQHKIHKIENKKIGGMLRNGQKIPSSMLDLISQPINNDYQYTINITLGTPEQSFSVALDTVSSTFWINDIAACSACPSYCKDPTFCGMVCNTGCCSTSSSSTKLAQSKCIGFNSVRSKTYVSTGQTISNNDTLDFVGQDTVRLGAKGTQQLVIPKTIFVQRTVLKPYAEGFDGILGLGFADGNISSPLLNAISQNLLDQPLFTIYLAPQGSGFSKHYDGTLTWGGLDSKHCATSDPIQYHQSTSPSAFQVTLDTISVGDFQLPNHGEKAVIDSGADGISGPTNAIAALAQQLQAYWASDYYAYIISCSATGTIDFTIDGTKYSVNVQNLLSPAEKNCVIALHFDTSETPTWNLGLGWFQSYCNVFNYETKSVGFVKTLN